MNAKLISEIKVTTGVDMNDAAHRRCRELNSRVDRKYTYSVSSNDQVFAWGPDGGAWVIDAAGELVRPWTAQDQR